MRAIHHADFVEIHSFIAQLQNSRSNERRLLLDVRTRHERGLEIAGLLDASPDERDARRRAIRATALESLNWEIERRRLIDAFRSLE